MDTSPRVSPRALNYIDSSPAAQAPQNASAGYERLLADFPAGLHAALRTSFPTILQLQSFWQDLAASDIAPGHGKRVQWQLEVTVRERQDYEGCARIYSVPHQSLDQPDAYGATPLHAAILESDEYLVRRLLDAGASPVHQVCTKQIAHEARSAASLVKSGALDKAQLQVEQEVQEVLEWPVFGEQASCSTGLANPHRHVNALFVDIAVTANERITKPGVTMAAHAGANALTFAIACGAPITMVAMLVEHGKRHCRTLLAQADGKGDVPLVLAAACGRDDVVRLLLQPETGIDVNQQDQRGHSALMTAARNGDIVLIGHLLKQCGVRGDLTNNHGAQRA